MLPERLALQWNQLTHRVRRVPILVLMPHSRCNCRCLMCDIWRANKNMQELDAGLLDTHKKALQRAGVRWVVLSGGEALMHSDLRALSESLRQIGVRITLLSTGLLLARNVELIAETIDDVIVSLDGSEPVHDRIRNIPRAFEKLQQGVAALKSGAPAVEIGARCVIQRENYHDISGVVEAAAELQLNWISFLAADVSSDAFNRPDGWPDDKVATVGLSLEQCDELEQELRRCFVDHGEKFASGFISESPDKLLRIVEYFRALKGAAKFPRQHCNAPWVSAVVEPDGQVRPCYFHEPYGNLAASSLQELLNSPSAIEFRRDLDVNKNPVCQRCVCTLNVK